MHQKAKTVTARRNLRMVGLALLAAIFTSGYFGIKCLFSNKNSVGYGERLATASQFHPQFQSKDRFSYQLQAQRQAQFRTFVSDLGNPTVTSSSSVPTKSFVATVRARDSLAKIFRRNGIDSKNAKAILALKKARSLREMRSGKKIDLIVSLADNKESKTNAINLCG